MGQGPPPLKNCYNDMVHCRCRTTTRAQTISVQTGMIHHEKKTKSSRARTQPELFVTDFKEYNKRSEFEPRRGKTFMVILKSEVASISKLGNYLDMALEATRRSHHNLFSSLPKRVAELKFQRRSFTELKQALATPASSTPSSFKKP